MADIFISYQNDDRDLARKIVDALSNAGVSVWWDQDIDPHDTWDREIERELARARFVLVLWTANSIESDSVRIEAFAARDARPRKLIQARFGECEIPFWFTLIQWIDLDHKQPDRDPNWEKLMHWIALGGVQASPKKGASVAEPERLRTQGFQRVKDPGQSLRLVMLTLLAASAWATVGYGWFRLLANAMPLLVAGFIAGLISTLALLLSRIIARALVIQKGPGGHAARPFYLYPLLFTISTLGVLNGALYTFEGRGVLQEQIDVAEHQLVLLTNVSRQAVGNLAPDPRTAAVEGLLNRLSLEISNPSNCRQGLVERAIVARLASILPEFRDPRQGSSGGMRCDDQETAVRMRLYSDEAMRALGNDEGGRHSTGLRVQIEGPVAQARVRLIDAEASLESGSGAGYGSARLALENAATVYREGRVRLTAVAPDAAREIPPALDIETARQLGSIGGLPAILTSRIDHPSTWIYLLIAALFDFMLVYLFAETSPHRTPAVASKGRQDDLIFLWVNQGG